jgi:hypothetical protein
MPKKKQEAKYEVHLRLTNEPELLRWLSSLAKQNDRSLVAEVRSQLRRNFEASA